MKFIFYIIILTLFSNNLFAFDHNYKDYHKLLNKYLKVNINISYLTYGSLSVNKHHINSICDNFQKVTKKQYKDFTHNQKLSFLINAYNVFTIKLIIILNNSSFISFS